MNAFLEIEENLVLLSGVKETMYLLTESQLIDEEIKLTLNVLVSVIDKQIKEIQEKTEGVNNGY